MPSRARVTDTTGRGREVLVTPPGCVAERRHMRARTVDAVWPEDACPSVKAGLDVVVADTWKLRMEPEFRPCRFIRLCHDDCRTHQSDARLGQASRPELRFAGRGFEAAGHIAQSWLWTFVDTAAGSDAAAGCATPATLLAASNGCVRARHGRARRPARGVYGYFCRARRQARGTKARRPGAPS